MHSGLHIRFSPPWMVVVSQALSLSLLGFFSFCAVANIPGLQPQKSWDFDGYIKYMATYSMPDDQSNTLDHLLHNRLILNTVFLQTGVLMLACETELCGAMR